MGDDTKPLSSGDRWRPTASGLNALQNAADYVENVKRGRGALANPLARRELGTVVLVKNQSSTQETWSMWSPVGVCVPPGEPHANAIRFANKPYFPGCRLDDYSFDDGKWRMLGIAQEPIPYGKTGRVCVRGVTVALVQKPPSGWIAPALDPLNSQWVHVHYDAANTRWLLRGGPGGDARLLQILDATAYQDGTHNDQCFALIDLCDAPHIVPSAKFLDDSDPYSAGLWGTATQAFSVNSAGVYWTAGNLAASPGWTVPAYKYARIYVALPDGVPVQGRCGSVFSTTGQCGPGITYGDRTQFFAGLPGARYVAYGWYQSADPIEDRKVWVRRKLPDRVWLSVVHSGSSQSIYLLSDRNGNPYDGGTYDGIVYPVQTMDPSFVGDLGAPNCYQRANLAADREFYATYDPASGLLLADDPSVWDDPIGTVKMWCGSSLFIPAGWRIYAPLAGCYPKGAGTFTGTVPTHLHGGILGGTGDTAAASCEPPNASISFIERYR